MQLLGNSLSIIVSMDFILLEEDETIIGLAHLIFLFVVAAMTIPVSHLELYCYLDINPRRNWPMHFKPDRMGQAPLSNATEVDEKRVERTEKPPESRPNEIMLDRAIHHF